MQAKARERFADADNWVGGSFWSADKGWPPWIAPLLDLRFLATQPFDEQICIWEGGMAVERGCKSNWWAAEKGGSHPGFYLLSTSDWIRSNGFVWYYFFGPP